MNRDLRCLAVLLALAAALGGRVSGAEGGGAGVLGLPAGPGGRARVEIREEGLYAVPAADLAAALGFPMGTVTQLLATGGFRLSSQGHDIPWDPSADGTALVFFGEPYVTQFTDRNVYWVEPGAGTPLAARNAAPSGPAQTGLTFSAVARFEENKIPFDGSFTNPDEDFWIWDWIFVYDASLPSLVYTAQVDAVAATAGAATMRVRLVGATDLPDNPEHQVAVLVNETPVGVLTWDGMGGHETNFTVAAGLLQPGSNLVRFVGVLLPGVAYSMWAVDSFSFTYDRYCTASGNRLSLGGGSNAQVTVDGFTDPDLAALDITDPKAPVRLAGAVVDPTGGAFCVTFATGGAGRRFHVSAASARRAPLAVQGINPVPWLKAATNEVDYLVVAHASVWGGAEALAAHRQGQGLAVAVADVADLYNEFNFGLADPRAVRDFLTRAQRTWARAPRYVALAGTGSFDYRNFQGYGECLVPPVMIGTLYGVAGSDYPYSDVDDDGAPEMAVGRINLSTTAAITGLVQRIKSFEAGGAWKDTQVYVADNPDKGGEFPADADTVAAHAPTGSVVVKDYLLTNTPAMVTQVRGVLNSNLQAGCGLAVFVGHAGYDRLADEQLFNMSMAAALTNASREPFLIVASCLMNRFDIPNYETLGEAMLAGANGGAVAVWAAIDLTFNDQNVGLAEGACAALFRDGMARIGDALGTSIVHHVSDFGPGQASRAFNLLGDPATAFGSTNGLQPLQPYGPTGAVGYAEWTRLHFAAVQRDAGLSAPGADPDGDAHDNGTEFLQGTDPWVAEAPLVCENAGAAYVPGEPPASRVTVQWPGVTGRRYTLQWTPNPYAWGLNLATGILATPPVNVWTSEVPATAGTAFFRVVEE